MIHANCPTLCRLHPVGLDVELGNSRTARVDIMHPNPNDCLIRESDFDPEAFYHFSAGSMQRRRCGAWSGLDSGRKIVQSLIKLFDGASVLAYNSRDPSAT